MGRYRSRPRDFRLHACLVIILTTTAVFALERCANGAIAPLTIPELVSRSDVVCRAKVDSLRCWWDSSHSNIFTTVTLSTIEGYKGGYLARKTLEVIVPGGELDGEGLAVEHAPRFVTGEEVIVFLRALNNAQFRVTGWEAGKLTIKNGRVLEKGIPVTEAVAQIRAAAKE